MQIVPTRRSRSAEFGELIASPELEFLRKPKIDAYEKLLSSLSKSSVRTYATDLRDFGLWMGTEDTKAALADLCKRGAAEGNALVMEWIESRKTEKDLSSGTLNRRMATLKSFLRIAKLLGVCDWQLQLRRIRHEDRRDTTGPGVEIIRAIDKRLSDRALLGPLHSRNLALWRLYSLCALRRMEPLDINYPEDVDLGAEPKVRFRSKAKRERQWFPIPSKAVDAIRGWLADRGQKPGPLFVTLSNNLKGTRMTVEAVRKIFYMVSTTQGSVVRPHGVRHTAATAALDATNGNLREVAKLTRHASLTVLRRYDDSRAASPKELMDKMEKILVPDDA
jgi:integrase/recombinase XerC